MSNTEISTYDRGKRVVLADDAGEMLAQATPCARMAKTVGGKRYRAVALMSDPHERARYQGRPMFDTEA